MELELKDKEWTEDDTIYTSETYYDLFDGGYICPKDFLTDESADEVLEAMATIEDFLNLLISNDLLEIN